MSIETLLIKQARLSDLRRHLKAQGAAEAEMCENGKRSVGQVEHLLMGGGSCIGDVYQGWKDCADADPYGEPSFEEIWEDAVLEGDVCQHCQNVRELKKRRMQAGRELAGVRAAITRVGRRLAREQVA